MSFKPMSVAATVAGPSTVTVEFAENLIEDQVNRIKTAVRQLVGLTEEQVIALGVALRERGYTFKRDSQTENLVSQVLSEILRRQQVAHEAVRLSIGIAGVRTRLCIMHGGKVMAEITGSNSPLVFGVARNFKKEGYANNVIAPPVTATTTTNAVEQPMTLS